jgi:hypothetical protein
VVTSGALGLERLLEGSLGLVESPRLDLALEKLVELGGGESEMSAYGKSGESLVTHPAGSGMMNQDAMANGAPSPV